MGSEEPALKVVYATAGSQQLREIWEWNAKRYGRDHADEYLQFLSQSFQALLKDPEIGKPIESAPELRSLLVRRKNSGHGHIVVYRAAERKIRILHVFHSAQDWQSQISED